MKNIKKISQIQPFISKYNWEGINYPSEKDDWKKIAKNIPAIALNVLYAKKEKHPAYVSKHDSQLEKLAIF